MRHMMDDICILRDADDYLNLPEALETAPGGGVHTDGHTTDGTQVSILHAFQLEHYVYVTNWSIAHRRQRMHELCTCMHILSGQ